VGKTEYALSYAEAHNAEIISCDASLVYRGMDIGTAKPSSAEQARVPHHLIDIREVNQPYDIVSYLADARRAVEAIVSRGRSVVLAGGSGFYLKSFLAPVTDALFVPDAVRTKVATLFKDEGLTGLMRELLQLNPSGVRELDVKNPRRVMRALERCMVSGKTLSDLQAEFAARPEPYADFAKRIVLLERDKEELKNRIYWRVEAMMDAGLIEEVSRLVPRGIKDNPSAASAIGYRETLGFLEGKIGEAELVPAIAQNTVHLAKKQRTWFRSQLPEPDLLIQL
jgi:tRNA dimethylallyltransferase